jgi:hypothetical protein
VWQALGDLEAGVGQPRFFPWKPISAKTLYSRADALVRFFGTQKPGFEEERVALLRAGRGSAGVISASDMLQRIGQRIPKGMTAEHRQFCLALLADPDRQRLLLNIHSLCWADAQELWHGYTRQTSAERRRTIDLCVLAAILGIVVHIPFRAHTIVSLHLEGETPDVLLPPGKPVIDLVVFRERMKVPKDFEVILRDDATSQPRRILDWFIAGPRQALLSDPNLLSTNKRDPRLLFGGIDEARYGEILSNWTFDMGMRMTTHLFRHAIATLLVNICEADLQEVATLLGNTVEVTARHYVFNDGLRQRMRAVHRLAEARSNLAGPQKAQGKSS